MLHGTFFTRLTLIAIASALLASKALAVNTPAVSVQIVDREIRTGASLFVPADPERVWEVITDFERMPQFMPDVSASRVISRNGESVRVFQKERLRLGPWSFPLESVREVRLVPRQKAESRQVNGSLREYESVMELEPAPGGTRIIHRSRAVPDASSLVPGESMIARGIERRFIHLRDEILRREQLARSAGRHVAAN